MKKLLVIMFVVLFAATAAYADTTISGMMNTRGSYFSNDDGLQTDEPGDPVVDWAEYDMEFDADVSFRPSEETFVNVNFEMHDETWLTGNTDGRGGTDDDNIEIKRVWGGHTFPNDWKLEVGLMTGGTFGHAFADNGDGRYRVKLTKGTAAGPLIFILEKNDDQGAKNTSVEDAEKDDADAYYVAYVTQLGGEHTLGILGGYVDNSNAILDLGSDGVQVMLLDVYGAGSLGQLGYEWEFQYQDISNDAPAPADDATLYGIWLNAWINPGPLKFGAMLGYGNYDDDAGASFNFGFDPDYMLLWDGKWGFGAGDDSIRGATMVVVYLDYAVSETVSLNAKAGFITSNVDPKSGVTDVWEDAEAFEVDVGGKIKISDDTTYDFGIGYGEIDDYGTTSAQDPDAAMRIYHRIKFSF
jgi:hypothetical protein